MGQVVKTATGCRPSQWFGEWSVLPEALHSYLSIVQKSDLKAVSAASAAMDEPPAYTVADGIATINLTGPMAKYGSSVQSLIGGASTLEKRSALRMAQRDPGIRAIFLRIDSPGGTVAGTGDLAAAVAKADSVKPVYAYIEDLGASAAYRVASRARKIFANADAQVGSIGTYAVLTDTSGAYEKEGVKVHVVKSGSFKGAGEDGTKITDAQLEETQRRVDALNEQFLNDVSMGRKMPMDQVRKLADGRVHMAAAAQELGLIDSVASLDEAMAEITRKVMNEETITAQAAEIEKLKAQVAELDKIKAELAANKVREELSTMRDSLKALKALPAPEGLAEALVQIRAAAPEAFGVLDRQIRAWDAQAKVAALFEEKGTNQSGKEPEKVNVEDPAAFRKAADERVAAGKNKNQAEAMAAILREQGVRVK